MKKRIPLLGVILSLLLVFGCAHHPKVEPYWPMQEEESPGAKQPETPPVVPLNPRKIEAELWISISNIRVLKGRALQNDNRRRGIPAGTKPQLHVWASGIIPRPNQHVLDLKLDGPLPRDIFMDKPNGTGPFPRPAG